MLPQKHLWRGLTKERSPTLNMGGTIPWVREGGWISKKEEILLSTDIPFFLLPELPKRKQFPTTAAPSISSYYASPAIMISWFSPIESWDTSLIPYIDFYWVFDHSERKTIHLLHLCFRQNGLENPMPGKLTWLGWRMWWRGEGFILLLNPSLSHQKSQRPSEAKIGL